MIADDTYQFTLDENAPFEFVDANVLALTQVQNVYQLNDILGAFLADDVQELLNTHKHTFFVLSQVWNETIQRVVLEKDDIIFPDGLLMIPPLFNNLGWLEDSDKWTALNSQFLQRFASDACLPNSLALLFIEAMRGDMTLAIEHFIDNVSHLGEDDALHGERYLENLGYFGWPVAGKVNA